MLNASSATRFNISSFDVCQFFRKTRETDVSPQDILHLVAAINALFSLVAVTGNMLILAAIWRKSSLRTPSYILLAGLAATDFATGLITQPLYIAYIFAGKNCIVIAAADVASRYFATVTAETITIMSVERWLHMSRRFLVTAKRAYMIYGALVFLSVPYMAIRLWLLSIESYRNFWEPVLHGILSAICFSTATLSYCKVFGIIRNQMRQVQTNLPNQSIRQPTITLKYKKSVYTVLYILTIFLLCYSPHGICIFIHVLWKMSAETFNVAWHFTVTLLLMSSSLNPLLYCWRIKEIRDEIKQLIEKIICN